MIKTQFINFFHDFWNGGGLLIILFNNNHTQVRSTALNKQIIITNAYYFIERQALSALFPRCTVPPSPIFVSTLPSMNFIIYQVNSYLII